MPTAGSGMPIRLRLAVAFAVIAAVFFALGGWLFASGLSSDESIQGQVARELAVGAPPSSPSRALAPTGWRASSTVARRRAFSACTRSSSPRRAASRRRIQAFSLLAH